MSNNKQSSVEWLISQLQISTYWKYLIMEVELMECGQIDIIEKAKAMHKEEIKDALIDGSMNSTLIEYRIPQYYNETFGGNNEQQ